LRSVKLLLDTHAFIWWDGDQPKLSATALAACQSTLNSLHLSLASVWELQIKMQLGKLALHLPLADVLRDQQEQNGLVLEPVTLEDIPRSFDASRISPRPVRPAYHCSGKSGRLSPRHSRFGTRPLSRVGYLVAMRKSLLPKGLTRRSATW
jgi:PIN domain nuclease of toxin-antitoxin system